MNKLHNIAATIIWLGIICLSISPVLSYAQNKEKPRLHKNNVSVGFRTGPEILFDPNPQIRTNKNKIHTALNAGIAVKKPISKHIQVEAAFNYSMLQNQPNIDNIFDSKAFSAKKINNVTLPVTIQYHPCNREHKIQPFVGAGIQYNFCTRTTTNNTPGADVVNKSNPELGTKYISLIFTQGVTFEINTKIQIIQSFHFIPNTTKTYAIDLGVGFNIR